ncbi:hypothetical protein [Planococcus sp. ISL-110]|uniref:hypothetical protein n=1 Tax=Planococcus sp. ISL-110 TaxID=2819167 RepID=UPI001BE8756D|nr:hypothetical protein [Planococcus sp. ISL-110]MBT2572060.1 hypothetical protein [Planococcus sp. ISL-110]
MAQKKLSSQKSVTYFFLKSKDVHTENGLTSITLFARLAREITSVTDREKQTRVETFWVQIDDLGIEHATEKVKALPNCMEKYEVSEKVFLHLLQLSKSCPNELYGVIPYYLKANREMFHSWPELEQSWQKNQLEESGTH